MKVKCNKETCITTDCDERHPNKCKYLTIYKSVNLTLTVPSFISSLKKRVTSFNSSINQIESINMSMVPQIRNLTHKLDIGNSKKEINRHDIFSGN